jgi:hypothetical protein
MANKKIAPEQVLAKLRQIEVLTAGSESIPQACKEAGIGANTLLNRTALGRTMTARASTACSGTTC